jgi:pimeloyl-ACP methyl ester carboxylesterase
MIAAHEILIAIRATGACGHPLHSSRCAVPTVRDDFSQPEQRQLRQQQHVDLEQLAPIAVTILDDIDAAAKQAFGSGYEHLDQVDPAVIRSYLEPWCGTMERARHFERMLAALDDADLTAVTPRLRELTVPTLLVWGTGDEFFDVSWARWLQDTIPGTTGLITVDGARLFFPDERPMDLVPHLEQHWVAAGRA